MMQGNQLLLHIHAGSHLLRTAHQDTDFSLSHLFKKLFPLYIRLCVMDKADFLWLYSLCKQRRLCCLIKVKAAIVFRRPLVAEDQLGQPALCCLVINPCYLFGAQIQLGIRVIRYLRVNGPGVCGEQTGLMGQLQEIVLAAVHLPVPDGLRPFCQLHDNPLLVRGTDRFNDLGAAGF